MTSYGGDTKKAEMEGGQPWISAKANMNLDRGMITQLVMESRPNTVFYGFIPQDDGLSQHTSNGKEEATA